MRGALKCLEGKKGCGFPPKSPPSRVSRLADRVATRQIAATFGTPGPLRVATLSGPSESGAAASSRVKRPPN